MVEFVDNNTIAFPKLSDFNYSSWKQDMKVLLMDKGCWEFITGKVTPLSDDATEKEVRRFEWRKQRAYTSIYQAIERKFQPLISDTESGEEAWKILKDHFEPKSRARLAYLVDEFFDLRYNPQEETIGIFSKRVTEKRMEIENAGFKIPELLVCFQLIRRLPPEFENLVQVLYRLKDEEFTISNVEKQLISESGRIELKMRDEQEYSKVEGAYSSKTFKPRISERPKGSGAVLDQNIRCQQNRSTKGNHRLGPSKFCHQKNHNEDMYYKEKATKKQGFFYNEFQGGHYQKNFVASTSERLVEFLVDSAATSHICNVKEWFKNYRPLTPTEVLVGDKRCTSKVIGIGDIELTVPDKTGNVNLTLKNVLFAPDMRKNLIGGANIDIAGYKIVWGDNKMILYTPNGEYFLTISRVNKLYVLYAYPKIDIIMYSSINVELAHRRFCHINVQSLKNMSRNKSVKGLDSLKGNSKNVENCSVCELAKSKRISFKRNYIYKRCTNEVLEKVSMDLWGPAPVNSMGNSKYFLSIIDDYSRKADVFLLKEKSEVFECFKQYLAKSERELNKKLKCVRTDNGLEFCQKKMEETLKELGIRVERTSTFTPEQNGTAEKFNLTAMNGVRSLLQESGLKPSFWAEALKTFVYVKNRSEHKLTKGLTPIEIWSGYKPSVKHFRVFGSLAYVHIPKVHRNKLQPRAKLGILVGYAESRKGYRVWLPKERRVVETIHVRIDETRNGVETLFGAKSNDLVEYQLNRIVDESDEESPEIKTKLSLVDISKWKRLECPRTKSKRIDVYYYPPESNERLRSLNDVKKYCNKNSIKYEPEKFSFKPTTLIPETKHKIIAKDKVSDHQSSDDEDYLGIFNYEAYNVEIPQNFEETRTSPNKEKWEKAMLDELEMMRERKVWELVDPPPHAKIIGSKWVYTVKTDAQNKTKKFKARLCAQGYNQRKNIDYNDVYSPVANFSILKLLFVILVSLLNWHIIQLDVKAAYLYGNLKECIYMRQPTGFVKEGMENKVCLLKKTIYGLHQSGREWNLELENILISLGFRKFNNCNCVYMLNENVVLSVYVDDIMLFGKTQSVLNDTLILIKSKLEITELGPIRYFLGINFDQINGKIYMHQRTYIERLEKNFEDLPKNYVNLPFKVGITLPPKINECDIEENDLMKKFPYRTLIGCLSFIANRSRPDIAFAVNTMAQFFNGYTYKHWCIVVDIFNYICNTKNYMINMSKVDNSFLKAYSDANWGCSLTSRHSTSGYIIYICNIPISWKSSKQKCIALSTMESEFIALTESVKELLWLSNVLDELNLFSVKQLPIQLCDNQSALYFCKNSIENIKTKHIDIKYKFIRQILNEGKFLLHYVKSKENLSDFLTKPLVKDRFQFFVNKIFEVK